MSKITVGTWRIVVDCSAWTKESLIQVCDTCYTLCLKKTRQLQRHDINILTKKLPGRQREKGMAPGPGLDPPLIHTMHNTSSVAIFMQYFVIYNSVNLTTQLWNWFNVWSNCYGNLKHCHHTQLNCNWTKTSWLI